MLLGSGGTGFWQVAPPLLTVSISNSFSPVALMAEDLAQGVAIAEGMLDEEALPAQGLTVGAWTCDLSRTQVQLFSELTSLQAVGVWPGH